MRNKAVEEKRKCNRIAFVYSSYLEIKQTYYDSIAIIEKIFAKITKLFVTLKIY